MAHKMKYVTVESNDILPELGYIQGPILHPTWISLETIFQLINNDRVVYEHCITDYHKRLRLTKKNYDDYNMFPENSEIEDPTVDPNTYLITLEDYPEEGKVSSMSSGHIYVKILPDRT